MNSAWASLEQKETLKEVESHCLKLLACLSAYGGGNNWKQPENFRRSGIRK